MISSLMGRMADAEKLDLAQLQQAVQNGTIPPYIGIPLIQDKARQAQQMQLAQAGQQAQAQQGQPSIAQQIMAQARGVEQLRSNLPAEEGYAAGGVIAFASGDLVDDDEEDDEDYTGLSKQERALFEQYMAGIEAQPELEGEVAPQAEYGISPERTGGIGVNPEKTSGVGIQYTGKKHKYENEIRNAARKAGIPEDLFAHMMAKETGGLANPESAVSKAGARGIAQFMPATAKQYGIDPMDINQALPAAAKMVGSLLKHYNGDERLAAMAYNWGQGNVDKWLARGADPAQLPKETANYVRAKEGGIMALAGGGVIAFEDGGDVDERTKKDREDFLLGAKKLGSAAADVVTLPVRGVMGAVNTGIRGARAAGLNIPYIPEEAFGGSSSSMTPYYDRYVRANEPKPAAAPAAAPAPQGLTMDEMVAGSGRPETSGLPKEGDLERAAYEAEKSKSEDKLASLEEMLKERAESAKNQKQIDAYMAILQAGLGMMGGSSPYAFTNIGKGASTGIEAAMAARKSQIAEENAILSGRLGLSKAELLEKSRLASIERQLKNDIAMAEHRKQQTALGYQKAGIQQQANLIKARKQFMDEGSEQLLRKKYEERYGKNWSVDPRLDFQFRQEMDRDIRNLMMLNSAEDTAPKAGNL